MSVSLCVCMFLCALSSEFPRCRHVMCMVLTTKQIYSSYEVCIIQHQLSTGYTHISLNVKEVETMLTSPVLRIAVNVLKDELALLFMWILDC